MSEDRGSQFDGARRSYFVGVASFFLALVLIGFAPSFFLKFVFNYPGVVVETAEALRPDGTARDPAALTLPIHVVAHSLFSAAWIGLFLVQAFLIRSNRRGAHQTLGGLGLLVAAGASITGFVALFRFMPRLIELADPPDPAAVLAEHLPSAAGDFGSFLVFTVAVLIGALLRHRPEWHKQLMLLASMTLLSPPMARIWMNSDIDNAMELWFPLTENAVALGVIGGYWLIRRRRPWVLGGGFVLWIVIYSALLGLGTTEAFQNWALNWMVPA